MTVTLWFPCRQHLHLVRNYNEIDLVFPSTLVSIKESWMITSFRRTFAVHIYKNLQQENIICPYLIIDGSKSPGGRSESAATVLQLSTSKIWMPPLLQPDKAPFFKASKWAPRIHWHHAGVCLQHVSTEGLKLSNDYWSSLDRIIQKYSKGLILMIMLLILRMVISILKITIFMIIMVIILMITYELKNLGWW